MRPDLQHQLFTRYPHIFEQHSWAPQETAMCWGIETGDGWYGLIDGLCEALVAQFAPDEKHRLQALQVKEKMGALAFYVGMSLHRHSGAVGLAEAFSLRICEDTGKPGRMHIRNGWYRTLCPEQGATEGYTLLPWKDTNVPRIPPQAPAPDQLAVRWKHLVHGRVSVPPGWCDVVDAALDLADRYRNLMSPPHVLAITDVGDGVMIAFRRNDPRLQGVAAACHAISKRIDRETGSILVPEAQ